MNHNLLFLIVIFLWGFVFWRAIIVVVCGIPLFFIFIQSVVSFNQFSIDWILSISSQQVVLLFPCSCIPPCHPPAETPVNERKPFFLVESMSECTWVGEGSERSGVLPTGKRGRRPCQGRDGHFLPRAIQYGPLFNSFSETQ